MRKLCIMVIMVAVASITKAQNTLEILSAKKLELTSFTNIANIQSVSGETLAWELKNAGSNLMITYPKVGDEPREIVLVMKNGKKVAYKEKEPEPETLLWCLAFYSPKPLLFEKEKQPGLSTR